MLDARRISLSLAIDQIQPETGLLVSFYEDDVMPFLLDLLISCLQKYPKKTQTSAESRQAVKLGRV
jgi:hypothetical protein